MTVERAWEIKQGDLYPLYRAPLTINGAPVDITLATGVRFLMKQVSGGLLVAGAAIVEEVFPAVCAYQWVVGDTDLPDLYQQEWEVMWPSGLPQTFPNRGYNSIRVVPDLG